MSIPVLAFAIYSFVYMRGNTVSNIETYRCFYAKRYIFEATQVLFKSLCATFTKQYCEDMEGVCYIDKFSKKYTTWMA